MFKIMEDNTIYLSRGDTARLTVDINNDEGEAYAMAEGDTLTLSVKKKLSDTEPCLKKVSNGVNTFHIEPQDTKGLPFGLYVYDVKLVTSKGDTYTVIERSTLKICEVT